MNDIITQDVALPAEFLAELAQEAKNSSATETPSIGTLSFKSGMLSYMGNAIPGNAMSCIVVEKAYERCYYDGPYDPNKIKNPVCFAIMEDVDSDAVPNDASSHKQHPTCAGCPKNEWGSAGEGRKGKACKEIRRLALIPTDKLQSPEDILTSEVVMAKVPVTSVSNWSNYVHRVSALHNMPFWAVVTKLFLRPHIKNQFEVCFEVVGPVASMNILNALKAKRELAKAFIMAPYSSSGDEEATPAPAPKGKDKKF